MQDSELNYFKDILESRKNQILNNIDGVNDEGDHASVNNNSMVESAIVHQQEQELKEINSTLQKIATNGYGICEMCEDEIGFQRLKVKPHAIYCIDCREIVEKSKIKG